MDDFDRAFNELNIKHQDTDKLAGRIRLFKDTDNLYLWSNVADEIIRNFESSEIPSLSKCPKCNRNLNKTILSSGFSAYTELYFCEHCRAQFNTKFELLIKPDSKIQDIRNIDFGEFNPLLTVLVNQLMDMGCQAWYYNKGGLYGYVLFEYNNANLCIAVEENPIIRVIYPNWEYISYSELTPQVIANIQNNNLNSDCNIFWLVQDNNICLSSTVNLDAETINSKNFIIEKINSLLDCKDKICQRSYNKAHPTHEFGNYKQPELIQSVLDECGCTVLEIDDEDSVWFKYNQDRMYTHVVNETTIKIVYNCMILNCTDQYSNIENDIDRIALSLQWVNMIYPIKATYYKPSEFQYSITLNIDISLSYFTSNNVGYIMQILDLLSVADEKLISDIVFGTEEGINIINTWYLPDVSNH